MKPEALTEETLPTPPTPSKRRWPKVVAVLGIVALLGGTATVRRPCARTLQRDLGAPTAVIDRRVQGRRLGPGQRLCLRGRVAEGLPPRAHEATAAKRVRMDQPGERV